jgi:hypothetical protein
MVGTVKGRNERCYTGGSNWTADEDQRLLKLVEAGKSWVFISAALKRPAKSARDRLAYPAPSNKS